MKNDNVKLNKEQTSYMEAVLEDINSKFDILVDGHKFISEGQKVLTSRIDNLETTTEDLVGRMSGVEVRLDGVETILNNVDNRLCKVETRLDGVEIKLDNVDKRLCGVESKLEDIGNVKQRVAVLEHKMETSFA